MKLPKRGQKGFTLIELLIVVAILGVLAAVVIPNIGQFIGAGEEEARETELSTIQSSVHAMMVANEIASLPVPVDITGAATNDMGAFPDATSSATVPTTPGKVIDTGGINYTYGGIPPIGDKEGYLLYGHDRTGNNEQGSLVNYVVTQTTGSYYTVDASGTVSQWKDAAKTPY